MKLITYIPESVAHSLRESGIRIHQYSDSISIEKFAKSVREIGVYDWEKLPNGQYQTEAVFDSRKYIVTIFENPLALLIRKDLICELNIYVQAADISARYTEQYLVHIYNEDNKSRDEVIDIHSAQQTSQIGGSSFDAPFLLSQLSLCILSASQD